MTREAEALKLLEAYQAEIEQLSATSQWKVKYEELASARAIWEAAPPLQAAIVRFAQRLPFQRSSYALHNLSVQLYKGTQSTLPELIEQGVLRSSRNNREKCFSMPIGPKLNKPPMTGI